MSKPHGLKIEKPDDELCERHRGHVVMHLPNFSGDLGGKSKSLNQKSLFRSRFCGRAPLFEIINLVDQFGFFLIHGV